MKCLSVILLLVLCCDDAIADNLTGSWRQKYTEDGGRIHPVAKGTTITLTIRGSEWSEIASPSYPNMSGFRARFVTNDSKAPKQVDLFLRSGVAWKGIYEVRGNTLKVCRTRSTSRPTRFLSTTDGSSIVEVYDRISQ
jgi:uncharacterized protein (TIGR03067 family)